MPGDTGARPQRDAHSHLHVSVTRQLGMHVEPYRYVLQPAQVLPHTALAQ